MKSLKGPIRTWSRDEKERL